MDPIMKGLDLSHWNDVIDMKNVATSGIKFVMLKFGGEEGKKGVLNRDPDFIRNYHLAKSVGLHVGCYFFMSKKQSVYKESPVDICNQFLEAISNYEFDMPIALDVEGQNPLFKPYITKYVYDWCDYIEEHNYYVTIYGSDVSTFMDLLNLTQITRFDKWVARYGKSPEVVKDYGIWQYTSGGSCLGIKGRVDKNYAYKNYPAIIKKAGLNK